MTQEDVKIVRHCTNAGARTTYFNTDVLMSTGKFTRFDRAEKNPKAAALLSMIYGLPGVQEAEIRRYEVAVTRSLAYEWSQIQSFIEGAIIAACRDGNFVSPSGNPMP